MNPLDRVDIIFKNEGLFWTVGAQTAAGWAFVKRARLVNKSQPQGESTAEPNTASVSVRQARVLMHKAQAVGLSVFEF